MIRLLATEQVLEFGLAELTDTDFTALRNAVLLEVTRGSDGIHFARIDPAGLSVINSKLKHRVTGRQDQFQRPEIALLSSGAFVDPLRLGAARPED
ncbi:hypothetical protein [Methylobacterium radiotolerans]|uniref:hypothetical protein n=1 Tax=Methylobacterium radiotolerans TaxID=31998 RepID=UPI001F29E5A6|nr:hypothetical protein [Methylobacterium radiotolerans]UIY45282.1 hypothetical protein LZ599_31010 [Methylobacterium radiotolerans]